MSTAIDKLRRILVLEREQGCRDRAVIGGLERFLQFWQKEAREQADQMTGEITIDEILGQLDGYADLPIDQRRARIEELVVQLSRVRPIAEQSSEVGAASIAPPQPQPAPKADRPSPAADVQAEPTPTEAKPAAAPKAPTKPRRPRSSAALVDLNAPVTVLKGIGASGERRLAPLGITTVRDLIYHFPRRYDDYAQMSHIDQLQLGQMATIGGLVVRTKTTYTRNKVPVFSVVLRDGTGQIEATWFNQPYLGQQIRQGAALVISGRVDQYLGRLLFRSPEWELARQELLNTGRLVPVYRLTEGVSQRWLRRMIKRTLDELAPRVVDPVPAEILHSAGLISLGQAIEEAHFPDSQDMLQRARQRLAFDEFLLLQLGVLGRRARVNALTGRALEIPQQRLADFAQSLPYTLTNAQQRAIAAITADLARPTPMARLLQGDVGSGKTVVAVAALLVAAYNGLQAALLAPTSILAEQHLHTITRLLAPYPEINVQLLVGSMPEAEKQRVRDDIAAGRVQVVIGTHALLQESVSFRQLGLVIVDEQHRFGVEQRGALLTRSAVSPHLLVMSATPIPRTLALTLYGDLDLSVLDELPPGRQEIVTAVRSELSRENIYSFMRSQVAAGRQGLIICPLVQESDGSDAPAAVAEAKRLQEEIFPHLRIGLLHGQLSPEEKERAMAAFAAGEIDILVSTSVVEVGIDVPNATFILIEGADRFGLAQLHQFRGRVGRGPYRSYCILMAQEASETAMQRLAALEATNDGFALAEKDLELRGPGDFFGVRQSGMPQLRVANLGDAATLEAARSAAQRLFAQDPFLERAEHALLAESVVRFWSSANLS
ncbi:MAG: ATP-dependent DNA helicase RecG [Anaerolineales bacterium]